MKPIAVIQHTEISAPGAIGPILAEHAREVRVFRVDRGEPVPKDVAPYGGLVSLGGSMNVHDPLPWIADELALIRNADRRGIPVAGHCLGSQLVALALGGRVCTHTHPEIGWSRLEPVASHLADAWWGPYALEAIETFQWHYDTFEPPSGSQLLASSPLCRNQAFIVAGRHLLIQSHLEATPEIIARMAVAGRRTEIPEAFEPTGYHQDLATRASRMHGVLSQLYARWLLSAP
ncbi:type 1 glutamine amidotransferase [Variovorax terrae]|uniref:Type 1 glutamine amidotransferase n=1 Tax=Variovorax terrae TaxID=2923278 RepID=A0A9X1W071_9BURK|nr:type 1 glutamine amidotransferase [Variovorax terrae]MCJ0766170.1 type 1 glutamine amidotransferase [Variovorax terrae]